MLCWELKTIRKDKEKLSIFLQAKNTQENITK